MFYDENINSAIQIYLGYGWSSSPRSDRSALEEKFGKEGAIKLERSISQIISQMNRIKIDWSKNTLASAGGIAAVELKRAYPGLSDDAIKALVWKFTFDWR